MPASILGASLGMPNHVLKMSAPARRVPQFARPPKAEHMAQATVQPRSIRLSNSTTRTAEAHMIERVLNGVRDASTVRRRKALSTGMLSGRRGATAAGMLL
jgi:hypothetical protein